MKKLLPILLLTVVLVEAKKAPKPSRWTKFTTDTKATFTKATTKVKDGWNRFAEGTEKNWKKSLYKVGVTDTADLNPVIITNAFETTVTTKRSKDAEKVCAAVKPAIQADISKKHPEAKNAQGLAFGNLDWNNINAEALTVIVNAAGSNFISKKLIEKALIQISISVRNNCGAWSSEEEVIAAIRKADLSKLAKKNAKFLENKKQ